MRASRSASSIWIVLFLVGVFAVLASVSSLNAQGIAVIAGLQPQDASDVFAYRTLFRQDILYRQMADQADAAHKPKTYLRHILATRYHLNADDSASLDRVATAYQLAIAPVHAKMLADIARFHARFPHGIVPAGADISLPPEIIDLQRQEYSITLLYRDRLRNDMREGNFQALQMKVRETFAGSLHP